MNFRDHERQPLRILNRMIESIGPGMLTSIDGRGLLISRPMTPLELDRSGVLWFFIRASSLNAGAALAPAAVGPAGASPEASADASATSDPPDSSLTYSVNIAFAQPDAASYVSVTGLARLVRDARREEKLWSPEIRIWFAQGKNDPDLALLRVDIVEADYWDASAASMVRLLPAGDPA
ncbi:MAG: hypothetical protein EOO28_20895 [Comamonadaceae bacterium]|nr:MAG: hypothetical protein EOO28_20895 [Comamonadaceae bacterium]